MKQRKNKYPWDPARIILVCGSGGVGKTTLSAAMALDYAKRGYKTIVLTVDPAARLAQALGLSELDSEPTEIKIPKMKRGNGSLDAMMLNAKRMFDKIVRKYSPDKETCDAVLNHPLYDHLSNMLAGSQEYMAMENLHYLASEYEYEKIIVDTPPSKHALDFFDAPQKMVDAITNSMLKVLVRPSVWAGKKGSRLLGLFSNITGAQFLQEMSDFLAATVSLLDGFKDRAETVMELITSVETDLVLVTAPTPGTMTDAAEFINSVQSRHLMFAGCIVNRISSRLASNTKLISQTVKWCEKQKDKTLREVGTEISMLEKKCKVEKKLIDGLIERYPKISIYKIPQTLEPIHNLKGLQDLYLSVIKN